jgi:CRP-like cAMP-binding protein
MIHFSFYDLIIQQERLDMIHGEVLFLPKMPVTDLFLIEKGGILVFSPIGDQVLRVLSSGQVIGLQDLLLTGCWSGLGVVHGPTRIRVFPVDRLRARLEGAPQAHRTLLNVLAGV